MGLAILGDPVYIAHAEFVAKVNRSCQLLRDRTAERYGYLYNNVTLIKASSRSGADVSRNNIDIARRTFDASVTWLASVLIHESIHICQYKTGRDYSGVRAEQECNAVQLEVLRAIGAPVSELNHMLAQTGTHFDLDGDGDYDWDDYRLREY